MLDCKPMLFYLLPTSIQFKLLLFLIINLKSWTRKIIVYSWSIINAYSFFSHEWRVPLIKFMVGPTIHLRGGVRICDILEISNNFPLDQHLIISKFIWFLYISNVSLWYAKRHNNCKTTSKMKGNSCYVSSKPLFIHGFNDVLTQIHFPFDQSVGIGITTSTHSNFIHPL